MAWSRRNARPSLAARVVKWCGRTDGVARRAAANAATAPAISPDPTRQVARPYGWPGCPLAKPGDPRLVAEERLRRFG